MTKTVAFSDNEPVCHTLQALSEEEYPLTFYSNEEIEQFRHEAVLDMMGVPSAPPTDVATPQLHMRRSKAPSQSGVEALAALAANPLQKTMDEPQNSGDRPRERQPAVRERRTDDPRRRAARPSARPTRCKGAVIGEGLPTDMELSDPSDSPRGVLPVRERRSRPARDGQAPRGGGRIVRDAPARRARSSVISALPPAPAVV